MEFRAERSFGVNPYPVDTSARNAENSGSFRERQPSEEPQSDQIRSFRVRVGQCVQGFIHAKNIIDTVVCDQVGVWKPDPVLLASVLEPLLLACSLHQDPPHGLGRRPEEMPPAVPVLGLLHVHQPHIRLVDQSRGL